MEAAHLKTGSISQCPTEGCRNEAQCRPMGPCSSGTTTFLATTYRRFYPVTGSYILQFLQYIKSMSMISNFFVIYSVNMANRIPSNWKVAHATQKIWHHHHTTTVLRPFFRDHPGEPVLEENFWTSWTLWCKGRLTEADTRTIRLGITPSGLISAHLHHPIFLQVGCPSCHPTVSKHWRRRKKMTFLG